MISISLFALLLCLGAIIVFAATFLGTLIFRPYHALAEPPDELWLEMRLLISSHAVRTHIFAFSVDAYFMQENFWGCTVKKEFARTATSYDLLNKLSLKWCLLLNTSLKIHALFAAVCVKGGLYWDQRGKKVTLKSYTCVLCPTDARTVSSFHIFHVSMRRIIWVATIVALISKSNF